MATAYQDKLASRRVMENIGMVFVRRYRLNQDDLTSDTYDAGDEAWDVEYALSAERFAGIR